MEDLTVRRRNRLRHHYTLTSDVLLFGYEHLPDGAKLTYQVIDSFDWSDGAGLASRHRRCSRRLRSSRTVSQAGSSQADLSQSRSLEAKFELSEQLAASRNPAKSRARTSCSESRWSRILVGERPKWCRIPLEVRLEWETRLELATQAALGGSTLLGRLVARVSNLREAAPPT